MFLESVPVRGFVLHPRMPSTSWSTTSHTFLGHMFVCCRLLKTVLAFLWRSPVARAQVGAAQQTHVRVDGFRSAQNKPHVSIVRSEQLPTKTTVVMAPWPATQHLRQSHCKEIRHTIVRATFLALSLLYSDVLHTHRKWHRIKTSSLK